MSEGTKEPVKVLQGLRAESQSTRLPEYSRWSCLLFGGAGNYCSWRPLKGHEPNWFHRWMQRIFFGHVWRKDKC